MEPQDITGSPFVEVGSDITKPPVVATTNPLSTTPQVDPLQLRPATVRPQAVGNLITASHAGLGHALFVYQLLLASSTTQLNVSINDNQSRTLQANPDVALYTNITDSSQISATNQWPNVSFGFSNLPWMTYANWGLTDNANVVTSVAMRNNNVNNVNVIVAIRWRLITNQSATFEQSFS